MNDPTHGGPEDDRSYDPEEDPDTESPGTDEEVEQDEERDQAEGE